MFAISIAAWVGMIALMGLDAETGVFMPPRSHHPRRGEARPRQDDDRDRRDDGADADMWSLGAGADAMKRVAAPMVGGLVTSFLMELLVCPAIYLLWKRREGRSVVARARTLSTSSALARPCPA
jgi:copper/silver efflux system protein